jgi:hypothetical protein
MANFNPMTDDGDLAADARMLYAAIASSDGDPRPHAEVLAWLLSVAAGEFDAQAPQLR